jgi:Trk K+ transport system NAD-binding subunit
MTIQIEPTENALTNRVLAYLKRLKIPYTIADAVSDTEEEPLSKSEILSIIADEVKAIRAGDHTGAMTWADFKLSLQQGND